MRTQLATLTLTALLTGNGLAQESATLADEADRINYTIGHQIGTDFKKQKVELDQQALQQGMRDGHERKQPLLDAREMNERLVDLKRNITKKMEAEAVARLEKKNQKMRNNRRAGQEFLEANRAKEGVKTMPSGLQYKVLTPGDGLRPQASDRVRIHYRARRLNGQEFNSSYKKGEPSVFRVNGVVPGFSEALQMMQPGAKWELYLPWNLAYGRKGPLGNEAIIIEAELLEILGPEMEQMTEKATPTAE